MPTHLLFIEAHPILCTVWLILVIITVASMWSDYLDHKHGDGL